MSGYMDLRRPRVYRCSNVGLVSYLRATALRDVAKCYHEHSCGILSQQASGGQISADNSVTTTGSI